jgi:hypothetical protein
MCHLSYQEEKERTQKNGEEVNQVNIWDIQSTSSNISGNQNIKPTITKSCKCFFSLGLGDIPMKSLALETSTHGVRQPVSIPFCLCEYNALATFSMFLSK